MVGTTAFDRVMDPPGGWAVGRAPAKLILMGEHFVVHGSSALAVPVDALQLEATARILTPGARLPATTKDTAHLEFCKVLACQSFGLDPAMVSVEVRSEIPVGAGMGSSAALSVAIGLAVGRLAGREKILGFRKTVREISMAAEKRAHGNPSGIDTEVCVTGRSLLFTKGQPPRYLDMNAEGRVGLVVMDTGVSASTAQMVALAAQYASRHAERFAALARATARDVERAAAALERGEVEDLGRLMRGQHDRLVEIGVSTSELDRAVDAAMEAGAYGAKLSGSGGGGVAVAVCRPKHLADVVHRIQAAGIRVAAADPL